MGSIDAILALRRRSIEPPKLIPKEKPKVAAIEPSPVIREEVKVAPELGDRVEAYLDSSGALYIPTPPAYRTFTRYAGGTRAYNQRSEIPEIVKDYPNNPETVYIDVKTLRVI